MANIDLASNSALLSVAEKLDEQTNVIGQNSDAHMSAISSAGENISKKLAENNTTFTEFKNLLEKKASDDSSAYSEIKNILEEKFDAQNLLLASMTDETGALPITNWASIQSAVRMGLAPKIFSIGDQLVCKHDTYGELVWEVIGFDCDTPADKTKSHSMTLQLTTPPVSLKTFCTMQALYYCGSELPAGTYYFELYNYSTSDRTNYTFTLSNPVPAGGQICLSYSQGNNPDGGTISTYASPESPSAIETVTNITEGDIGTFLGATDGTFENVNHTVKFRYGLTNWEQSHIRQWLQSDADIGCWWTPSNRFDRPPRQLSILPFLNGIDSEFLSVLGKVVKKTALSKSDDSAYTDTEDLIFLLSLSEIYGGEQKSDFSEGEPYPYYKNYSSLTQAGTSEDANRIKYKDNAPCVWLLRSADASSFTSTLRANTAGAVSSYTTSVPGHAIPGCCIV